MQHVFRGAWRNVGVTLLAFCASGCGDDGPTAPSSTDGFARTGGTLYMVNGLSSRVVDTRAAELEAVVRVGERIPLTLNALGDGSLCADHWITTNAAVGTAGPIRPAPCGVTRTSSEGQLNVYAEGVVSVFVEFEGPDGKTLRTTLAFCEGDAASAQSACSSPREIARVRVVP